MRAIFLIFLFSSISSILTAQNIAYPLNENHEGTYELTAHIKEEYSVELPGKSIWKIHNDTTMLEVEKEFKQYTGYKMAIWKPLRQYPFGIFRKQKIQERMNFMISPFGSPTTTWFRNKNYDNFNLATERSWFFLTQCMLPVPPKQLEEEQRWNRTQFRQIIRNKHQRTVELNYRFWKIDSIETYLGYQCQKVMFSGSSSNTWEGFKFSQRGTIYYDIESGKAVRLEIEGHGQLNDLPFIFQDDKLALNTNMSVYQFNYQLIFQEKNKRKDSIIKEAIEAVEQAKEEQKQLVKQFNWKIRPIYLEVIPLKNHEAYNVLLEDKHYLLDEKGKRWSRQSYINIIDGEYNGYSIAFDGVHWQVINNKGQQVGAPFSEFGSTFNLAGYMVAKDGSNWEIRDTTGKIYYTTKVDYLGLGKGQYFLQIHDKKRAIINREGKQIIVPDYEISGVTYDDENDKHYFIAKKESFICLFNESGTLIVKAKADRFSQIIYPYAIFHSEKPKSHSQLYNLNTGAFIANADYFDALNRTREYYFDYNLDTDQTSLVHLVSGDTIYTGDRIKEADSFENGATTTTGNPFFYIQSLKENGYPTDNKAIFIDKHGKEFSFEGDISSARWDDYLLVVANNERHISDRKTGKKVTTAPFLKFPQRIDIDHFWMHFKNSKPGVFNCKTQEFRELPNDWKFVKLLSQPNTSENLMIISKDKRLGIIDKDFNVILPPIANKIERYYETGILLKIKGKKGILIPNK